jgi:hypothetical protein
MNERIKVRRYIFVSKLQKCKSRKMNTAHSWRSLSVCHLSRFISETIYEFWQFGTIDLH